jgi:hypothetical protein
VGSQKSRKWVHFIPVVTRSGCSSPETGKG